MSSVWILQKKCPKEIYWKVDKIEHQLGQIKNLEAKF